MLFVCFQTREEEKGEKFYREEDLDIGEEIVLGGKSILLESCDAFTAKYYSDTYNKSMEPLPKEEKPGKQVEKVKPPYNGFGTEEDSLTSCDGLEPRPPQRDFFKFMERDRKGFESHVLRFSARLVTDKITGGIDKRRKFVVSYFLSDDTILINQIADINSGKSKHSNNEYSEIS